MWIPEFPDFLPWSFYNITRLDESYFIAQLDSFYYVFQSTICKGLLKFNLKTLIIVVEQL